MKHTLLIALIVLAACTSFAQSNKEKLDSLMDFYRNEYGFNGVALISYKGNILINKGYGYKNIEKEEKNDEHTIFQMGSNTKQFTAEIILQLAMQQKLGLQDKVGKYFPDYPNGNKITLENLLTHTSGIYNYTKDTSWQKGLEKPMSRETLIGLFKNKPLSFEPGSKFEYSNSNYILLGFIIEKVTGKKYETVVRENILIPCGMAHSGFDFVHLQSKDKATGYYTIQEGHFDTAPVGDSTISFAAGALYSDAADMYKWHEAIINYKLLPKEWQEKAFTPHLERYGYGWFIDSMYNRRSIGHSGGVPGFYTYEDLIPQDDVCILLLQNCELPQMDNNTICINIIKCMYKKDYKIPSPRKSMEVAPEILKTYTGNYAITNDFILTISLKGNDLYAQATGQSEFLIHPQSETVFYTKEVGAEIKFIKDKDGKVNKLILNQGGQEIPATRQ